MFHSKGGRLDLMRAWRDNCRLLQLVGRVWLSAPEMGFLLGFGSLFADEAPFHFNRRWRRFAQIKDPANIALPTRFLIQKYLRESASSAVKFFSQSVYLLRNKKPKLRKVQIIKNPKPKI